MKQYRIIRNTYNGKGDQEFKTYNNMFDALRDLGRLELFLVKGYLRIEERDISEWNDTTFEVRAYGR